MTPHLDALCKLLPPLVPVREVILGSRDVLIHAPGFEDRTLAVCEVLQPEEGSTAILLDYEPFNANNRMKEVRDKLMELGVRSTDQILINYNRFNPGDFEIKLEKKLEALRPNRIVLDISTMSKLAIILIILILKRVGVPVLVFYSEAEFYGPSEAEFNAAKEGNNVHQPSLQIFTGIHGVVRVDSLASVAMQGQPTAALVFMSFNDALTQSLLNAVYPTRLFLINGNPPEHSWREMAMAWIHDQVRGEWEDDNPPDLNNPNLPARRTSTLDYRETVVLLLKLYWELSTSHRILLAPAGSKLQSVGCSIVKALHPDVHIEYPSPQGFLKVYSKGIGNRWCLNFNNIADVIGALQDEERREYLQIGKP